MSTVPYAITTLAKVKSFLNITDTSKDALLEALIAEVTDFVESLVGDRRFLLTQYVDEEYDFPDGNLVFLRQFPITEVTKAQHFSGTIAVPTWIDFNTNDFQFFGAEGYIRFFLTFRRSLRLARGLRFTYKAGFLIDFANEFDPAQHSLPHDLTLLATQLIARNFDQRFAQGKSMESVEGSRIEWDPNLTKDQKAIVNRHQRHSYAS